MKQGLEVVPLAIQERHVLHKKAKRLESLGIANFDIYTFIGNCQKFRALLNYLLPTPGDGMPIVICSVY